jgi:hypothetical protein
LIVQPNTKQLNILTNWTTLGVYSVSIPKDLVGS